MARLVGRGRAPGRGRAARAQPRPTSPACPSASRCPTARVRHYFLRADDPDKAREVQALVRRLQRMDVEVRRLSRRWRVPDFRAYGRAPAATTLPAGTYWIPMAQRQKHWIQAMLNESTYTPVGYAYDIVGWSSPLLFNVAGGSSGAVLSPRSTVAGGAGRAGPAGAAGRAAVDRALLDVAAVRARDRVLGLAALAAGPLGRRLPRRVGRGHRERRPDGRRGAARARRLRAQGPERPVGSLRLQGPRARRAART